MTNHILHIDHQTTRTSILGVLVVLISFWASAQQAHDSTHKNMHLNEVIVTGQYGENTLKNSVYKVRLIDQKRIQQQGAVNLKDVLSNELNIRVSNDAALGSGMTIQGMSGQNVKIMIDGIPVVGREGGSVDLTQINLNNIERIEYVEGPMSVNFGTDALGGVINLITKTAKKNEVQASANGYYESSGKYNAGFTSSFSNEKWMLQLNGARNFFDGFSPKDSGRFMVWKPYTQYFGDINIGRTFKRSTLKWQNSFFQEKVTDRDSGTITPYYAVGFDHYYYTLRLTTSAFYHLKINNHFALDVVGSYNFYRRINNTVSKDLVTMQETLVPSKDQQDTTFFHVLMSRGTLSENNSKKWISYQLGYEINHEVNQGDKIKNNKQYISDYNVFGSTELKVTNRLVVRPAIRFIYNTKFNAPIAPSLNVKWEALSFLSIRASYGRGFRAPTLKELYLQFVDPSHYVYGNPNLKAETADNYQLTATCEWKKSEHVFRIEPSFYYNNMINKIVLAQRPSTGNINYATYQYYNVDVYRTAGVNLSTEYRTPKYGFVLGYAYAGINNNIHNKPENTTFYFSNEFRCNANYTLIKPQLTFAVFYKFNGKQQIPQLNNKTQEISLGYINPFSLLDATVTKSFWKSKINLTAGCKNIVNVQNVSASMSTGVHSDLTTAAMIGMGRTFFCSLSFKINYTKTAL